MGVYKQIKTLNPLDSKNWIAGNGVDTKVLGIITWNMKSGMLYMSYLGIKICAHGLRCSTTIQMNFFNHEFILSKLVLLLFYLKQKNFKII